MADAKTIARDARVSAFNFLALRLGSAMRATGGVNTFFGKHEAFYRPTVHDVRFDNLLDIRGGNAAIPDTVRINHDCGPVFALIETARHIRAHSFLEPT